MFQYVTEKMGGAEGTKLDLDFVEMERVSMARFFLVSFVASAETDLSNERRRLYRYEINSDIIIEK